jgi:NADPH-dependent dioxygenase
VTLRHAGGAVEHCVQDWLVGADGGHSTVRKRLGLRLLGESTQTWLIADAVVETDLPRDSIHWMHTGDGTIMLVPFPDPGKWRLLDTVDVDHDGDPEQVAARFRTKISRALGTPTVVRTPTWVSVFTIQQRMIERMRVGRCFVAGDAAHVHSPASGQGMNTGVQDAYNLGWKLAEVARGEAEERLLDSYGVERVPVGRVLLGSTKKATALVALKNAAAGVVLPVALGLLRRLTPVKRRIERKIMKGMSGLALSYPDSPISLGAGERVEALVPGDRPEIEAELRSPRWTLLAFGPCGFRGDAVVSVCEIDGPEAGTWLLARPDGYLAARGELGRPQDIRAALDAVGLRAHDQSGLKSGAATSG